MEILLVCTGNTCRSAMAEGILRGILDEYDIDDCYVTSAGVATFDGLPASQNAVTAAGEVGSDISLHQSRQLAPAHVYNSDLILCMTEAQKNHLLIEYDDVKGRIFTLAEYVGEYDMEISDPYGGDIETYRECAENICYLLERLAEKLSEGDSND